MKNRYTLLLNGTFTATTTFSQTFSVDIRKLIPVAKRGKKFLLKSWFDTTHQEDGNYSGLRVGIELPQTYNQNSTATGYLTLGVASPVYCDATQGFFKYLYTENLSNGLMIDYPEISSITVHVRPRSAVQLIVNSTFLLCLIFEEIDD